MHVRKKRPTNKDLKALQMISKGEKFLTVNSQKSCVGVLADDRSLGKEAEAVVTSSQYLAKTIENDTNTQQKLLHHKHKPTQKYITDGRNTTHTKRIHTQNHTNN